MPPVRFGNSEFETLNCRERTDGRRVYLGSGEYLACWETLSRTLDGRLDWKLSVTSRIEKEIFLLLKDWLSLGFSVIIRFGSLSSRELGLGI